MVIKDDSAEKLAMTARESLSSYCYLECKAHCCRKGYLLLTAKEVDLMQNTRKEDLKIIPVQMELDKRGYVFNLGLRADGCPKPKKI
jgi:hypothetical protein